ncbi:low affinity iron permease family protein [Nocardioides coralli]|uniref:low affinity iron permease family protein n=1 Tax=Nocardioides coralli TaxID=2872154 RepID=UPI001CA3C4BE|nr:low affinity iron permease family protein [Nocardioides coralli]QZY29353.1 low affinity iron permease family protein [Nocardioides coralli]
MSDRTDAAQSREGRSRRGRFESFVEAVNGQVSRAPFFVFILALLTVWVLSFPLWPSITKWELALHTGTALLSLLLLVLLENAGRRANEAQQEKLNVIAEALSDLMESRARDDDDLHESVQRLREAVGLEERH